jgi:hypothetical protein
MQPSFIVAVWTRKGLQCFMVLFFIELSSRARPDCRHLVPVQKGFRMNQIAPNLTDAVISKNLNARTCQAARS